MFYTFLVTGERRMAEDIHLQIALIEIYPTMYYMCSFKLIFRSFPSIAYQTEKVEVDVGYLGRLIRGSWELYTTPSENDGEQNVLFNFFLNSLSIFFYNCTKNLQFTHIYIMYLCKVFYIHKIFFLYFVSYVPIYIY